MERLDRLEQDVRDLAATIEALIAAALIAADDPDTAMGLLRNARAMVAAIREGDPMPDTMTPEEYATIRRSVHGAACDCFQCLGDDRPSRATAPTA